jgi:hypothetical protein
VVAPKRERLAEVIDLARKRDELLDDVDVDVSLLCDMLVGPVLYRTMLTCEPPDDASIAGLVDTVLRTLPVRT